MPVKVSLQRLLFIMPLEPEAFIAALAAIHAYTNKLTAGGIRTDVTLVAKRDWLTDLLVPLSFQMVDEVPSNKFDLALELTEDRAVKLAQCTSRSCASGFSILLGFENINELVTFQTREPRYDLAILNWGDSAVLLHDAVLRIDPSATIDVVRDDASLIDEILDASMVVGVRSTATYLAASVGRSVVELDPQDEFEKSFYAKWSNPRYTMMPLESRIVSMKDYSTLWVNFQRIWRQFVQHRVGQSAGVSSAAARQS